MEIQGPASVEHICSPVALSCWADFLLVFPFAAVHWCVLLKTKSKDTLWMIMQATWLHHRFQAAGLCLLVVLPFHQKNDFLQGFAPREFQGWLSRVDLFSGTQPSYFFVVLVVLFSFLSAHSCPLLWICGEVVAFPHGSFTSTFTSTHPWTLVSSTSIFCRSLW